MNYEMLSKDPFMNYETLSPLTCRTIHLCRPPTRCLTHYSPRIHYIYYHDYSPVDGSPGCPENDNRHDYH